MVSDKKYGRWVNLDLAGQRFGTLTVLSLKYEHPTKGMFWQCHCSCCDRKLFVSLTNMRFRRGCDRLKFKNHHRMWCAFYYRLSAIHWHPQYMRLQGILGGMRDRCGNPRSQAYQYYGARGIEVCKEWMGDKDVFYEWALDNGYAPNLSIDREDNFRFGYSPSNCRWITNAEQQKNKRSHQLERERLAALPIAATHNVHAIAGLLSYIG